MAAQALLPAALGFGLLLAVFPFGTWMPAVAADAPPIVAAFVFTVGQAMALFLALVFLRDSPFSLSNQSVLSGIQLAGLLMAAIGGIMASAQRDFGRLFGYAAMSDLGYLLLALGTGGSQSSTLALLHMLSRSASITLLACALAILRHWATTDRYAGLQGVAKRLPVATMGLMLGGLAMAGFPFTAGFPTHWAVNRAVWNWVQPFSPLAQESAAGLEAAPGQEWVWGLALIALVVSSLGIVIGLLRGLSAMLGNSPRDDVARQPVLASLMVLGLVALTIVLGLYPQLFLEPAQRAAQALSLF
jgi:formate hydrogenlyase subunit 3/multisubunit Na+/H+ antiporter MnhD subunit